MRNYIELFQNKLWYQSCVALLAFLSGGMFLYEIFGKNVSIKTIYAMNQFDFIIACVFLIDFWLGVLLAQKKLQHIKTNWLDLLGSIPLSDGIFRAMRILRFTRLVRLIRASNSGLTIKGGLIRLYRRQENPKK